MSKDAGNPAGAEVFISYAQDADQGPALALADHIEGAGATVWIAERSIDGAQNYADEIVDAIDRCTVLVVLCSVASMASRHVRTELNIAFEAGRPRLPLVLDATPFPGQVRYWLADANRIDITGSMEQWLPRVLRALNRLGVRCDLADLPDSTGEQPAIDTTLDAPACVDPPPVSPPVVVVEPAAPRPAAVELRSVVDDGYRTPGIASGYFRTPGDIHAHIDGGRNVDEIVELLKALGESDDGNERFPGKFNRISRFSGGPQRDDKAFAETYQYHTPGSVQKEAFDSFSTVWLGHGSDIDEQARPALKKILDTIADQPGAVVELERVIGILDTEGQWYEADPPRIADPRTLEAPEFRDFPRLTTSTIEIHHSVDLPKRGATPDEPVFSVDQLPKWPHLGGWFLFDKGGFWSYRSSEFVGRTGEYHYAARAGQKRLSDHLEAFGHEYELHTLVEQVLGIWRGGTQPPVGRYSIPAIGEWELSCPPGGHVWVIAANFYGDQSPDVKRAMLENLGEGVTYTYFLRTHADMLRLGLLADELERGLVADGFTGDKARATVAENVRCVLLSVHLDVDDARLERLLRSDYFLSPYDREMGGYRLESSGLSGERIDDADTQYIVDALNPLLESKIRGLFLSSEESWAPKSSNQTVVCTDLEESAVDQGEEPWLKMLAAYDRIVAREVSSEGKKCLVVRPVRNGYLLVFEKASEAAEWARRLQFEVRRYNEKVARGVTRTLPIPTQNVALSYGSVSRVLRAHGYDHIGGAIDDCIDTVARLHNGVIAMSRAFAGQYEGQVGKQEFLASTRESPMPELSDLRLLDWS